VAAADWPLLDLAEAGYERIGVEVASDGGEVLRADTYAAGARAPDLLPLASYLRLVAEGAREHGLPADWVAALERLAGRGAPPGAEEPG